MPDIARDVQTGFLISASAGIRKRKYTCVCPGKHSVCLRRGPKRIAHFAHIPLFGQGRLSTCRSGGESEQHIRAKHKLVQWQGRYRFALKTCKVCHKKTMEDCSNGKLEIEMQSIDKRWRYDVLLTRQDKSQLALEVYHTHATGDEKVASSAQLGVPIAEFDAQEILDLQPGGSLDNMRDALWICSQSCVDHKRREEQEMHRRQQEARALENAKRQEAARILEENKQKLEAALAASRAMEKSRMEWMEARGKLEMERKLAQEQAHSQSEQQKLQRELWQAGAKARYEKDLREWEECQLAYKKLNEIKLPFEKP
jgi:hypothetical protein